MKQIKYAGAVISVPMPIFLVIEDVGWWQGVDGSMRNEPFRNRFGRCHTLADYQTLARLAQRLSMRIVLGMVMGEWDRTNYLKGVPGATWMGKSWDNRVNQGPWLEETAQYLRDHSDLLEIALHGICHEFWQNGQMQRSEFHDQDGRMRPWSVIQRHIEAFANLLEQNGLHDFPRLFIPPALNHSFGNKENSIQALLHSFGIDYVTTRFDRAYQYSVPIQQKITWEGEVCLLERGISPVKWDAVASAPVWHGMNPILPLHWGNLLHPQPEKNNEIVDRWADMLLAKSAGLDCFLAEDLAACWRQAAVFYLADVKRNQRGVTIDMRTVPGLTIFPGSITVKIQDRQSRAWNCNGAEIISSKRGPEHIKILKILAKKKTKVVTIFPT